MKTYNVGCIGSVLLSSNVYSQNVFMEKNLYMDTSAYLEP